MIKRSNWPLIGEGNVSQAKQYEVALDTLEFLEDLVVEVFPLLFGTEGSVKRARLTAIIFTRQVSGKPVTVSDLVHELGYHRSGVQHVVDALIDQGLLKSKVDPDDARRRLLLLPRSLADEYGAKEQLLVKFRLKWHRRLASILAEEVSVDLFSRKINSARKALDSMAEYLEQLKQRT